MTAREVIQAIKLRGGREVRQVGSHKRFTCPCEKNHTTVSEHRGDIPPGTLRKIERDLEPCPHYGKGWLR